jgi:hypothetical protein
MSQEIKLKQMVIEDLAYQCAQETTLYFRHLEHDTRYCFELFRRAIEEKSKAAWDLICRQYETLVTGWVNQHYAFRATREDAEYFVNGAFGKISSTITADKFESFPDLGYLLRYLKMCVHSVIMDYTRKADYTALYDLDEADRQKSSDPLPEEQAIEQMDSQTFWKLLQARLHDNKERGVIEGSFILQLKPQEICEHYRSLFSNVDEVYQVKQNVISRLRRDAEFRKLLGFDD